MKYFSVFLISVFFTGFASTVSAQDKYDQFVGQYVASVLIANACAGVTVFDASAAATIAKTQNGLRKQKVLRLVYYGKTNSLVKLGNAQLTERGVRVDNKKDLCRFGRSVSGKNYTIGRFLQSK